VDEYWIVDWRQRTVDVYRRQEGRLESAGTLTGADRLTSPVLPGFDVEVGSLFD
jgi:Uma2 family endonuclease